MIALWAEVYVRTETAYSKRIEEAKAGGYGYSGEKVLEASDVNVRIHPITHMFPIPENMRVTYVYSAWYQPTLFHENLNKFKTLDVVTDAGGGAGSGVFLEAQSVAGEDAQINLRVHMICEIQPKS